MNHFCNLQGCAQQLIRRIAMNIQGEIEYTITEHSPEYVLAEMPVRAGILNPDGVVNPGAMLWFADACATALACDKNEFAPGTAGALTGIGVNADIVGNQKDGVLKALSRFVKYGSELSTVRTIITGTDEALIADVTTSYIVAK
jgi:acyl-coenzyme A thioesterase PaaI-like protein